MTSVSDVARARGVTEVLHFTTNRGLIGMFHRDAVFSRDDLNEDEHLDNVKLLNCASRARDADWTGYVNLSISVVNNEMLGYSQKWHEKDGIWWAVLAFDVSLLDEPGVYFTTTNNAYPVVKRGTGIEGFEAMFAEHVPWGKFDSIKHRPSDKDASFTTDIQAEVLVLHDVPLSLLRALYVPEPQHLDDLAGMLAGLQKSPDILTECKPEIFQ